MANMHKIIFSKIKKKKKKSETNYYYKQTVLDCFIGKNAAHTHMHNHS